MTTMTTLGLMMTTTLMTMTAITIREMAKKPTAIMYKRSKRIIEGGSEGKMRKWVYYFHKGSKNIIVADLTMRSAGAPAETLSSLTLLLSLLSLLSSLLLLFLFMLFL